MRLYLWRYQKLINHRWRHCGIYDSWWSSSTTLAKRDWVYREPVKLWQTNSGVARGVFCVFNPCHALYVCIYNFFLHVHNWIWSSNGLIREYGYMVTNLTKKKKVVVYFILLAPTFTSVWILVYFYYTCLKIIHIFSYNLYKKRIICKSV